MKISGITYVPRKTHKLRKTFIYLFILILLVVTAIMVISAFAGWNFTHPAKAGVPTYSSNITPVYKDITFTDKTKSINLNGWYFESTGSAKTIIMAHGYKGYRLPLKEKTFDIIKSFKNKGYNVLTFDFRNSGKSEGTVTSMGLYEIDDLLGAIEFAKYQGSKHIVLMGYSMGASTCILAAAENPTDVDAVIADSPFSNLKEYLDEEMSAFSGLPSVPFNTTIQYSAKLFTGLDAADVSPRNEINKFSPKPILFIHGDNDQSISFKNSQELHNIYSKTAGNKSELWITKGSDHMQSYEKSPQEYMDKVYQFLNTKVYIN